MKTDPIKPEDWADQLWDLEIMPRIHSFIYPWLIAKLKEAKSSDDIKAMLLQLNPLIEAMQTSFQEQSK